ncbi:MAG: O-antigen biosynthesis glycosyltransferase WbnJ [Ignavibacteriaceae bacterium]|nr:O-antigen biosynthesis glycosyltransferase WbnJ [Ignavibacteriaceae bacterium]
MVTVLLPTYNAEKYIAQCIKSILHQTYRDFELLIIDSASDDNTIKIIKSFEDSRINLHQIERCPLGRSLNYGLKNAKFDLIARMDADDLMVPERLEVQLAYLKEHPEVDVLSCDVAYFRGKKVLYRLFLSNTDSEIKRNLRLHNVINHSGCIYDRRKILAHRGYSEQLDVCIDYELWLRIFEKVQFSSLSDVLIFYRISENSVTRKDKNKTR